MNLIKSKSLFELEQLFLSTEGRLNRKPFILYAVAIVLFGLCLLIPWAITLIFISTNDFQIACVNTILSALFDFACLPAFFVGVKRLHDVNKSAVFVVLSLIPPINIILIIYLLAKKGTVGANKYGKDLLATDSEENLDEGNFAKMSKLERVYFSTVGRIDRKQFIKYAGLLLGLIVLIILVLLAVVAGNVDNLLAMFGEDYFPDLSPVQVIAVFVGASFIAILALPLYYLSIRRLHDFNFMGWWLLIPHIVPIAWIPFVVLLCIVPSRKLNNRYD